jgi:N-acetylglutamate synthase-like GNAT family acetyltransferase
MSNAALRRAVEADQPTINRMVKEEGLDPTALHWSHFLIAEVGNEVAGIGQIRPYPHCRELGSLAVREPYRSQGIGSLLVRALLAEEKGTVYLECPDYNVAYYQRFGFRLIPWWRAPMPLRLKAGAGALLGRLWGVKVRVMQLEPGGRA